jgi:hypothetical protein
MRIPFIIRRPFIWLKRFRYRRGYGVHSPFAFNLISRVIYERWPYYSYASLRRQEKQMKKERGRGWLDEPLRLRRLLFRLVNCIQPRTIVDAGNPSSSSLYLQRVCCRASYHTQLDPTVKIEVHSPLFVYIHCRQTPSLIEAFFRAYVDRATSDSLFVIEGIGYNKAMRNCWERMKQDERVGITFDLYDAGLLFFDHSKIKQHYIVNF